jgi:hypothetical protein
MFLRAKSVFDPTTEIASLQFGPPQLKSSLRWRFTAQRASHATTSFQEPAIFI